MSTCKPSGFTGISMAKIGAILFFWAFCSAIALNASAPQISLTLNDAQTKAIENSWAIKAAQTDAEALHEAEKAAHTSLFPRVSFEGVYTYVSTLPDLQLGPGPAMSFGSHHNYNLGPKLTYNLWDTFASRKTYDASLTAKRAVLQDVAIESKGLRFEVQVAYARAQLGLEELQVLDDSVSLAKSQNRDIIRKWKAGAATQLDKTISERQVLAFKLLFRQKQSELSSILGDLFVLIGDNENHELSSPGIKSGEDVITVVTLDSISQTLKNLKNIAIERPGVHYPQIQKLELLSASLDLEAESWVAKRFPRLDLAVSTALTFPNGPVEQHVSQSNITLMLSIPLYFGDPSWHLAEQKRRQAGATRMRARELHRRLGGQFDRAVRKLKDLSEQEALVTQDVSKSEEIGKLIYQTFKNGRGSFLDVQSANNETLKAKLNLVRIKAQMLLETFSLIRLTAKEFTDDKN